MRCSEFVGNVNRPIVYTCGRCAVFYYQQETLLEHLYWRHGTESDVCTTCQLKKWPFAVHICHYLPNMAHCASIGREDVVDGVGKSSSVPHKDPNEVLLGSTEGEESSDDDFSYFSDRETKFCYCGKHIEGSQMIGCDGGSCILEWYHYQCVGIEVAPAGSWFCPDCLKRS